MVKVLSVQMSGLTFKSPTSTPGGHDSLPVIPASEGRGRGFPRAGWPARLAMSVSSGLD